MSAYSPHAGLGDGMTLFKQGGETVGEVFEFLTGQLLTQHAFNGFYVGEFFGNKEGQGISLFCGTTCSTDTVYIIFRVLRHVVINDMSDACDVESASCNIGGHKNGVFSRAKAGKGFRPLCL